VEHKTSFFKALYKMKPLTQTPSNRALRLLVLSFAFSILETLVLILRGPPGTDVFAHYYYLDVLSHHGIVLWNNFWYEGTYLFANYSITPYLIGQILGLKITEFLVTLVTLSVGFLFSLPNGDSQDQRYFFVTFLVIWPFSVESGDLAYLSGVAFAAVSLFAYYSKKRVLYLITTALSITSSPLATGFLAIAVFSIEIHRTFSCKKEGNRALANVFASATAVLTRSYYIVVLEVQVVVVFILELAFASSNFYPFFASDAAIIIVFSLLSIVLSLKGLQDDSKSKNPFIHPLTVGFALYLAISVVLMVIPTPVGANMNKLSEISLPVSLYIATKVMKKVRLRDNAYTNRTVRPYLVGSIALLVLSAYWTYSEVSGPLLDAGQAYRQSQPSYWSPAISFLRAHLKPGFRVEVVDTPTHAEAYFLPAAQIPIVRGWFRQADFPNNELLYRSNLSDKKYLTWLHNTSAAYVVLTKGPYDFSAVKEATLLASKESALKEVYSSQDITIYRVPYPLPIVSPNAKVVRVGLETIVTKVYSTKTLMVSINFSPFLVPSSGCLTKSQSGLTLWHNPKVGVDSLHFSFTWRRFLGAIGYSLGVTSNLSCRG